MEWHIRLLAWIYILYGGFGVVLGGAALWRFQGVSRLILLLSGGGYWDMTVLAPAVLGLAAMSMAVAGIPSVIAGFGLLRYAEWSRLVGIVVAVLSIPSFPVGLGIAIYAFWVLTSAEADPLFLERPPRQGTR
ncbi:MAG TPA: hypothetical protein DEH78_29545 [Solibacterales bacterium]|nr:hypothetical protein [Bryobacterales bacterium]